MQVRGLRLPRKSAPREGFEPSTYRLGGGLSSPASAGHVKLSSPLHLHKCLSGAYKLILGSRAAMCRGMPFCPCYLRVDLRPGPGLCCLCVGANIRTARDIRPQPDRAKTSAARLAGRASGLPPNTPVRPDGDIPPLIPVPRLSPALRKSPDSWLSGAWSAATCSPIPMAGVPHRSRWLGSPLRVASHPVV